MMFQSSYIAQSLVVAGALLSACAARASISHEFTFDDVATGTVANALPQPAGLAVSFYNGVFLPDLDPQGDPIPGTERWRADGDAPAVIVDNPSSYNRGNAPSPLNALEALFQPVLVMFPGPFNIDPSGFSLVLDLDAYGTNGLLPGNGDIAVQFFNASGGLLASVPVDQTTPGFNVNTGGIDGVSMLLLPAGAFYDNLSIAGVPEPATLAVVLLAAAALRVRRVH